VLCGRWEPLAEVDVADTVGDKAARYDVVYRLSGVGLDPAACLATARPRRGFDVWRRGDLGPLGRPAPTSGIRMTVTDGADRSALLSALEDFLASEHLFLKAMAGLGPDAQAVLSCALFVYPITPATVRLPHALCSQLHEYRIDWEVTGYPCSDDEG